MIPYGRQDISQSDIDAVVEVLQSDFITQGPVVQRFEDTLGQIVGARYSVAMNSATSALHAACIALELGPDDWLWTSPISFVASANCGIYCQAKVDFVDIDPHTYNLCADKFEAKLAIAKAQGRLPKVVVVVHLCGQSAEMDRIHSIARNYGVKIIEDASHAIGGKYKNSYIGNCTFSDITVFSFHPVKIVTTGEGGVATTNDPELHKRLQLARSHGVTRDTTLFEHDDSGPWYYEQVSLGFNYRMTDIQAALGWSQLKRLDEFVEKRNKIAARYDQAFADISAILPFQAADNVSARHLYVIQVLADGERSRRRQVFDELRQEGLGVNVHYIPIHLQPFYRNLGFSNGDFPIAEEYYSRAISLPLFSSMTEHQVDSVIDVVRKVIGSRD